MDLTQLKKQRKVMLERINAGRTDIQDTVFLATNLGGWFDIPRFCESKEVRKNYLLGEIKGFIKTAPEKEVREFIIPYVSPPGAFNVRRPLSKDKLN